MHEAGTFALETVRIAGVVIAAPLAWQSAPLRVRGVLVLLLAFAAHAEGSGGLGEHSIEQMAFSVGSEFMLGLGIGFVVRLFVAVAEMAADHIAPMMGIGAAQLFDPQTKIDAERAVHAAAQLCRAARPDRGHSSRGIGRRFGQLSRRAGRHVDRTPRSKRR